MRSSSDFDFKDEGILPILSQSYPQEEDFPSTSPIMKSSRKGSYNTGGSKVGGGGAGEAGEVFQAASDDPSEEELSRMVLSPKGMLTVFTMMSLLNFIDRGVVSAFVDELQGYFHVSSFEIGLLAGAFILGYCVASPIFAHWAAHTDPFNLMAFGLSVWILAVTACGLALNFEMVLAARVLTGFGEASFLCIAPIFIDKIAPKSKRSLWVSIFFVSIPCGYALGDILGGQAVTSKIGGDDWCWRLVFLLEAVLMVPFVIFCLYAKTPFKFAKGGKAPLKDKIRPLGGRAASGRSPLPFPPQSMARASVEGQNAVSALPVAATSAEEEEEDREREIFVHDPEEAGCEQFNRSFCELARNPVYMHVALGYAAQTFVTGGVAYWGIGYMHNQLSVGVDDAGYLFGGVTLFTGIVGTACGGYAVDYLKAGERLSRASLARPKLSLPEPNSPRNVADPINVLDTPASVPSIDGHTTSVEDKLGQLKVALKVSAIANTIALPFCVLPFIFYDNIVFFLLCITFGELCLFCCLSPINNAIMWSVPFRISPQAMAMSIVFMHVLGDAISPLLVGFLLDVFDKNYHLTMLMLVSWLTFSCLHWLYAWRYVENLLLQASRNDISAAKLTNRKLGWDDEDDDGHTPLLSAAYRGEESISSDRGLHGSNGSGLGLSRGDGGQPDHSNRDLRDSGEFSPMLTPVFNHSTGERSAPIGVRMKLRTPSREQAAAAASNGADDDDKATGSGRTGSVYSFKLDA